MNFRRALPCALSLLSSWSLLVTCASEQSFAAIITQWTFENEPISGAPPYNNSPTPSTGSGTAIVLGMTNNYGTPNASVEASDILADPGSSDPASQQAWRVRGQGLSDSAPANGWSTLAPQYSQGAEFDVSTVGFIGIHVTFDWQPTNRGVEDIELQYNADTSNAAGWTNAGLFSNTVPGGIWNNNNSVDLSALNALANDPHFGIRIVSAYHPGTNTYWDTTDSVLNNSSGNIRLDNVTIDGTAVPEPGTWMLALTCLAGLGVASRHGRSRRDPTPRPTSR